MASGLSSAVGFKNGTDGDLEVALNAMLSAAQPHAFLGINGASQVAVTQTRGNPFWHLILRGGVVPNYDSVAVAQAEAALMAASLPVNIVVDCSHTSARKNCARQALVLKDVVHQVSDGNRAIKGVMLESNLFDGNQKLGRPQDLRYGVSITDACLGWDTARSLSARSRRAPAFYPTLTPRKERANKTRTLGGMRLSFSILSPLLRVVFCAAALLPAQAQDLLSDSTLAATLRMEAIAYEHGEGVGRNPVLAATLYCKGARLGDAQAQYNLGWMYANGRGMERNDVTAAFFFHAAAEQGLAAAKRMLNVVGGPTAEVPDCMQQPVPPPAAALPVATVKPSVNYQAIAPRNIFDLVMKMAPRYKVEPQLALAIIAAESNFDSLALSPKNAKGLMQLIPETSERFNVGNPYDPAQNIRGGLTYLRWLLAYFEGDVALVAAAYNAGERKVERYRGVPPYLETRAYVQRILKSVGTSTHPFDETVTRPSSSLPLIRLPRRVK